MVECLVLIGGLNWGCWKCLFLAAENRGSVLLWLEELYDGFCGLNSFSL